MSGGPKYEYLWCDNQNYKKPTHLSAPQYISLLMEWIEKQINDETVFPVTVGVPFPKNFQSVCKKLLNRLFRVFVHVNTCYKHFIYFVTEFNLLNKQEIEPLVSEIYPNLINKFSII